MSKSRRRTSSKTIYIILGLSLALSLGYIFFRSYLSPAEILVTEQSPISYGPTIVTGSIRKEILSNKQTYILITDTGLAMPLGVTGIDNLIGSKVIVEGVRLPIDVETGIRDILQVSSIIQEVQ